MRTGCSCRTKSPWTASSWRWRSVGKYFIALRKYFTQIFFLQAALNSTSSSTAAANFNSELGLTPATVTGLIEGFDASLVRTLYSQDGYELAKTVIMIFSTKKIQALTDSDVTKIKTMQTLLTTVLRVQILAEISTVQTAITDSGSTLETTEADITKFTFPLTEETQESETSLTEVERLTIVLKALLANKNGLETAIAAISTALSSTSSSGASGAKVKIFQCFHENISIFSRGHRVRPLSVRPVSLAVRTRPGEDDHSVRGSGPGQDHRHHCQRPTHC